MSERSEAEKGRIIDEARERREAKLKAHPDFQRRSYQMTREERARDAKDRLTKNIYEQQQRTGETQKSYADAERHAEQIVQRYVREVEK